MASGNSMNLSTIPCTLRNGRVRAKAGEYCEMTANGKHRYRPFMIRDESVTPARVTIFPRCVKCGHRPESRRAASKSPNATSKG